jgi:hypothetical protein
MSFPVDIVTMSAEMVTIKARDDWSVWELKCAVEKSTGVSRALYKLLDVDGIELLTGPLQDFRQSDTDPLLLYLVKLPKPQDEAEWFERWSGEAPAWFKQMGQEVAVGKDFRELMGAKPDTGFRCNFFHVARGGREAASKFCHPTKVLRDEELALQKKPCPEPILKTGSEVLAVVKKVRLHLQDIEPATSKGNAILQWGKFERTATIEGLSKAIIEDPCLILESLKFSENLEYIVDLVAAVVAKHPQIYEHLPECLMEQREVLYTAIQVDPALKEEFLQMAGRHEIRDWKEWQYPKAARDSRCKWSWRCRECPHCFECDCRCQKHLSRVPR